MSESTLTLIEITIDVGEPTGEYIVNLKDDESMAAVLAKLDLTEAETPIHKFTIKKHGFAGFAGVYSILDFFWPL